MNFSGSANFNGTVFGPGGNLGTAMQTIGGSAQVGQSLYRMTPSASQASGYSTSDPSQLRQLMAWIQANRQAEYVDAADDAHAVGLYNIAASSVAAQRYQQSLTAAAQAATGGTDLRSQLGSQLLMETQAIIALSEEVTAIRGLLAEMLRLQAAQATTAQPISLPGTSNTTIPGVVPGNTTTNGP